MCINQINIYTDGSHLRGNPYILAVSLKYVKDQCYLD